MRTLSLPPPAAAALLLLPLLLLLSSARVSEAVVGHSDGKGGWVWPDPSLMPKMKQVHINLTAEELNLEWDLLRDDGMRKLADTLVSAARDVAEQGAGVLPLRSLRLGYNELTTPEAARAVADLIGNATEEGGGLRLEKLSLRENSMGNGPFKLIVDALVGKVTLEGEDERYDSGGDGHAAQRAGGGMHITTLDVSHLGLTGDEAGVLIARLIRGLPNLESLTCEANSIGAGAAREIGDALEDNTVLEHLSLASNAIADGVDGLAYALTKNEKLRILNLAYMNGVGDYGAQVMGEALQDNDALYVLDLSGNEITAAGAQLLADGLRVNERLGSLLLKENDLRAAGATAIFEAIGVNTALKHLTVVGNRISADAGASLKAMLQQNEDLESLNIAFNTFSQRGMQYLAQGLRENQVLRTLNVDGNRLHPIGAGKLAKALVNQTEETTGLRELSIEVNDIGDAGAHSIARALKTNKALTYIALGRHNHVGDAGAASLASALRFNTHLRKLEMVQNDIGSSGIWQFYYALKENKDLIELDITGNPGQFSESDTLDKIADMVSQNREHVLAEAKERRAAEAAIRAEMQALRTDDDDPDEGNEDGDEDGEDNNDDVDVGARRAQEL